MAFTVNCSDCSRLSQNNLEPLHDLRFLVHVHSIIDLKHEKDVQHTRILLFHINVLFEKLSLFSIIWLFFFKDDAVVFLFIFSITNLVTSQHPQIHQLSHTPYFFYSDFFDSREIISTFCKEEYKSNTGKCLLTRKSAISSRTDHEKMLATR